jgi:hypothetical protein
MTRALRRFALAVALSGASGACGTPPPTAAPEPTRVSLPAPVVEGPVAATVDGEPIGLAEVEATARATGLSPIEALHRLEQERVLLRRAEGAALGLDAQAEDAARRASVQALLRARVEESIDDDDVGAEEIAASYEAHRSAWAQPERRASVHVLATAREGPDAEASAAAATRFIQTAILRLAAAADPAAEANAIQADAEGRTFTISVETLPPTARHGSFEEPYLAALFAIPSAPGVAPRPVTTSYGVHAIVLTSIEPPFELSLAEATPILRRQLVAEHRGAALDALAAELATRTPVAIDERVAAIVLRADLDDPRRAP